MFSNDMLGLQSIDWLSSQHWNNMPVYLLECDKHDMPTFIFMDRHCNCNVSIWVYAMHNRCSTYLD